MPATAKRSSPSGPEVTRKYTATVTVGALAAATVTVPAAVTVTGVRVNDTVMVTPHPGTVVPAGCACCMARVTAANTVEMHWVNPTAAPIAAGDLNLDFTVNRFNA